MELINNRYRVVTTIKQNRLVTSYLVNDIFKNNNSLQLNIINSEYIPKELLQFYTKEFITLTSMEHSNILKLYQFGLVKSIDNKRLANSQYYYTVESSNIRTNIYEIINQLSFDKILDLFAEICKSINYIHLKGFFHGSINPNNIFINYREDTFTIKVLDLATVELEKYDYWTDKSNEMLFKAPEILAGANPSPLSDIYSLGILLLSFCKRAPLEGLSPNEELNNLKFGTPKEKEFFGNITKVISKMINRSQNHRYKNITELIDDINTLFNKNYTAFNVEEIEKINLRTRLVGRKFEIKHILNIQDSMLREDKDRKFILVHGESGIGKTRLLKEIKHLFYLNKVNVYSSFALDGSTRNSNKGLIHILKKMVADCDTEILEKYESELVKLIPELGNNKKIIPSQSLTGEKETFRLTNTLFSFASEFTKNKFLVFIIDNAHFADEFTVQLLEYLLIRKNKFKKILFIISYNDLEYSSNKKFSNFINQISNNPDTEDIALHGLSGDEAAKMVQAILNTPVNPVIFSSKIYNQTYGNPLFIQETIKNFFSRKMIYVDPKTGTWYTKFSNNYTDMPIPSSMEQAVLNQIKEINEDSYSLLKTMSLFNTAISVETFEYFLDFGFQKIDSIIEDLLSRGIISKKIEDRGFVYDFYNKILKNLVYSKLEPEYKKANHEKAAIYLEKQHEIGNENKEELIYHLEMAGVKDKVIKYCLENAEKMEKYRNIPEAIKNLEKALTMYEDTSIEESKLRLIMKLGDLYDLNGNIPDALKNYIKVEKLSTEADNKKYLIDAINKMGGLYFIKNDLEAAEVEINKAYCILNSFDYLEGLLMAKRLEANIELSRMNYDKCYTIISNYIGKCTDDMPYIKALFYGSLGNFYMETSKIVESKKAFEESLKFSEAANNPKGVVSALNNLGVIYGDYLQDAESSLNNFLKMKDICEQNNLILSDVLALSNIAACYYEDLEFEASLKYFSEASEKSKKMDYENNLFYCYNNIALVNLMLDNYSEAHKYYLLAKSELELYPYQGREFVIYYQAMSRLFLYFGDWEYSKAFSSKALELYENEDSLQKWEVQIVSYTMDILSSNNQTIQRELVNKVYSLLLKYSRTIDRYNTLYMFVISLIEHNVLNLASELIDKFSPLPEGPEVSNLEPERLYICGVLCKTDACIDYLSKALEASKNKKRYNIYWKTCDAMGDYYFNNKNYFYGINYYFEACEIIHNLVTQLPDEYKINFVKCHGALRPFSKLATIREYYDYNKIFKLDQDRYNDILLEQLQDLFNSTNYSDILSNKSFIHSARKIYNCLMPKNIKNIEDIVLNLPSDPVRGLELILKYLSGIALATRGLIVLDDQEQGFEPIASSNKNMDFTKNKSIFDRVKVTKEPIIISEDTLSKYSEETNYVLSDIKAAICIPIIITSEDDFEDSTNDNCSNELVSKRKKSKNSFDQIKGYLYLESEKFLNNFNNDVINRCQAFMKLLSFIIDKYQLKISSSIDKLTQVLTRKSLEDSISENIEKASTLNEELSFIMFDLDHFKNINDKFGHQTGDEVLKKVCQIVKSSIRKDDICGRYGGEEFIVILPNTTISAAYEIAERLRATIEKAKILGNSASVTLSMGISCYPEHGQWKQELIENADKALYIAKESGRNRCQAWSNEFSNKVKITNRLTGIVSGNAVQDFRNVLVMVELIKLINEETPLISKIYSFLGRLIEFTESQYGTIYLVENDQITQKYSRQHFHEDWIDLKTYNKNIIESVIEKKQGVFLIDWDEIRDYDSLTGIPDWHSVIVVPLINEGKVKGILSLSVSIKQKEFKYDDLNFVNTLGDLAAAML